MGPFRSIRREPFVICYGVGLIAAWLHAGHAALWTMVPVVAGYIATGFADEMWQVHLDAKTANTQEGAA